ncbi:MAG TPA: class I SAM-dependent methyltransferase [Terriglobia bacterium]|nr:class I SAM-dependent methyltransferase [Terriglobia bacterium]
MQVSQASTHADFAAFDLLAASYDQVFTQSVVGRAQREAVWHEMDHCFHAGQRILEINCGTGADAIHLAQCGVQVVACDASTEMILVARRHAEEAGVQERVEFISLKTENIFMLGKNFHFDGLVSNFGGLNCSLDVSVIARELATLLRPGAKALLCVFSPFCAWETLWYLLHARPGKAFRRFRPVASANLAEGKMFPVYRHSVRSLKSAFAPYFRFKGRKGVGISVPPSYVEPLASRIPRGMAAARMIDRLVSAWPLFRSIADHNLMMFERSDICPH